MKNLPDQPNPLLDPFVPAGAAWSLITAVSVGIFEALGQDLRYALRGLLKSCCATGASGPTP